MAMTVTAENEAAPAVSEATAAAMAPCTPRMPCTCTPAESRSSPSRRSRTTPRKSRSRCPSRSAECTPLAARVEAAATEATAAAVDTSAQWCQVEAQQGLAQTEAPTGQQLPDTRSTPCTCIPAARCNCQGHRSRTSLCSPQSHCHSRSEVDNPLKAFSAPGSARVAARLVSTTLGPQCYSARSESSLLPTVSRLSTSRATVLAFYRSPVPQEPP